jgi:hypothetical protein
MARVHINNDLRNSLTKNGIGNQKTWDFIGKLVDDCQQPQLTPAEQIKLAQAAMKKWNAANDVQKIRDDMRSALAAAGTPAFTAAIPATGPAAVPPPSTSPAS